MTIKNKEQKSGLSTTSFVLSIIGLLLSITIIGLIFGIPLAIAGLIFGIIALLKKQKKGTAIAGIIIGGIVTLTTITIMVFAIIFLKNNADVITKPIIEISEMMDNDPELAKMMNDPEIQAEFEKLFKERLTKKFGEDFMKDEEFNSREDIKDYIPLIFDEMKATMLELKEKHSLE